MTKLQMRWLTELTNIPTATGREHGVMRWVERWAEKRKNISLRKDRFGNLWLWCERRGKSKKGRPIVIEAHMDHPAFVVTKASHGREVEAEFRGRVELKYFRSAKVELCGKNGASVPGRIAAMKIIDREPPKPIARVKLARSVEVKGGEILRWNTGKPRVRGGMLQTPVCDDLALVAGALMAMDVLSRESNVGNVRLLLSRAEEVGFVGATAVCRAGMVPKEARVIVLEASKSFTESPVGGGPIVRVGDRTSIFDRDLVHQVGQVAARLAEEDRRFRWQRKLMQGGTCNATVYCEYGHRAMCVCLPLRNYHNMDETAGRIAPEIISLKDFDGLVKLLTGIGRWLDQPRQVPPLRKRLDRLYGQWKHVLKA